VDNALGMKAGTNDYSLFFNFIDEYLPTGFKNIDREDPLIRKLETIKPGYHFYFGNDPYFFRYP
jgi:hypothetical protein